MSAHWKWKAIWLRQYLGALHHRIRCHFFPAVGYNYWPCREGAAVQHINLLMLHLPFVEKEVKCCRGWRLGGRRAVRTLCLRGRCFSPSCTRPQRAPWTLQVSGLVPGAARFFFIKPSSGRMMFHLTFSAVSPRSPLQMCVKRNRLSFSSLLPRVVAFSPWVGHRLWRGSSFPQLIQSSSGHRGQNVPYLFINGS